MTNEIKDKIEKAIKETNMVKTVMQLNSEDDIVDIVNTESLPAVGYNINQTGIDKFGFVTGIIGLIVIDVANNDSNVIQCTKDSNMTIIKYIYDRLSEAESCNVDVMTERNSANDNVSVASMVDMIFRY